MTIENNSSDPSDRMREAESALLHDLAAMSEYAKDSAEIDRLGIMIGKVCFGLVGATGTLIFAVDHDPKMAAFAAIGGSVFAYLNHVDPSIESYGMDADLQQAEAERGIERLYGIDLGKFPQEEQL